MAYRKVDEASLTAVADSIRAKGGTTGALAFLDGFVSAVQAIQAGGGEADSSFKDVIERTAVNPTLPSDLTKIGDYAFYYCTKLVHISLPSSLTSIGYYAFFNCQMMALTSLPDGLTSIGDSAFQNCTKLALTSLPDGLTSIRNNAFYGCTNLALTSLPDGLTSIGGYAFQRCTGLTTITFEGTPTGTINSNAFKNCTNLTTINVPWAEGAVANAPWGATNATINYNYTGV